MKSGSAARGHAGSSGFRLLSAGVDGFLTRAQMANAAQRSLDLQYLILRADITGRPLTDAALRAHPKIEVRVFKPFVYRGSAAFIRALEFTLNEYRQAPTEHKDVVKAEGSDYALRKTSGEPLAEMLSGRLALVWAHAQVGLRQVRARRGQPRCPVT